MTSSFPTRSRAHAPEELPGYGVIHPFSLSLVLAKGGTGKTSTTANLAVLAAARGYRTLVVDLDPQGGQARELGIFETDLNDDGDSLTESLMFDRPLKPVKGVRENLDLVVGGRTLERLTAPTGEDPLAAMTTLQRALVPLHDDYDLILFDHPPALRHLRELGLAASRFLVIPTRADDGSLDGVSGIARDFARVREANPKLELLGVVLFGVGSSSKTIRSTVRAKIADGLGQAAPVFDAVIRHAEAPAIASRNRGQAVHEYLLDLGKETKFTERQKAKSTSKLADDYAALAVEVLSAMRAKTVAAGEVEG
jgi:chromosome partitioning protein